MKPHFEYCLIGDQSTRKLDELLDRDLSAVIIGPPGAGKRYLLELINRLREKQGREPFPIVAFAGPKLICREHVVAQALSIKGDVQSCDTIEEWSDAVRQNYSPNHPLRLFLTNLDGISKTLAHRVLSSVQSLVKDRVLITVVTGEGNLIDLVDGSPTSAWSCANQLVVHSHDRRHFHRFLTKRMRQARLQFPKALNEARKVFHEIYQRTGGDVSLARAVFWSIGDKLNFHFEQPGLVPTRIGLGHLPVKLTDTHIVPVAGVVPFRYGCHCILAAAKEASPVESNRLSLHSERESLAVLGDLEKLLWTHEPVYVGEEPHLLELAGFARREEGMLRWFSPYTESFATDYFTRRSIGDLYAFGHDWGNAYRLYEELPFEEKVRPLSDSDHVSLMRLVDGVAIRFHRTISEATNGHGEAIANLRYQLRQALNHLTGIPNEKISCWSLDWQEAWVKTSQLGDIEQLPQPVRSIWALLATKPETKEEEFHSSKDGYHWVLCRDHDGKPASAILIDGRDDPLHEHPLRTSAIQRILRGYRRARERRLFLDRALREKAEQEILKVFWRLTKDAAWETDSVLSAIAPPILRSLRSVSRIIYLAIRHPQAEGETLSPLFDSLAPGLKRSDFVHIPIPSHFAQLLGISGQKGILLPADRVNSVLRQTRLSAFKREVACIMLPDVKGILLLESAENEVFSQADARFVCNLSERIKPSWDQGLRLKLLQESIEANYSPSLLLDRNQRILFANQRACDLLELRLSVPGWQTEPIYLDSLELTPKVREALTPSKVRESREEECITSRMSGVWLRECHPLSDKEGAPRGWVLTFRDRAFLYNSFELIRKLEGMNNFSAALELILAEIKKWLRVEHAKLRFYLRDAERPNRLVGKLSLGLSSEHKQRFMAGEVYFDDDGADNETAWLCIRKREPIALRLTDDGQADREGSTLRGLKYYCIKWKSQFEVLERKKGDISIDLPLLSEKSVLGKLTINFSADAVEELPAELPKQLGALSVVLGGLLDRVSREEIRQKMIVVDAHEQALRTTAHNLLSQISPFAAFIARYRLREAKLPELKPINDDLEAFHDQARNSVRRLKDRIGEVRLHLEQSDLSKIVEGALRIVVTNDGQWCWESIPRQVNGLWDRNHLANVFIELAYNSRDFVRKDAELSIVLSLQSVFLNDQESVVLRYADNGCGVAGDIKERIFDGRSFRNAANTNGRGLGLAYVRRVIEAHGGSVREIGELGKGAVFEFVMPVRTSMEKMGLNAMNT